MAQPCDFDSFRIKISLDQKLGVKLSLFYQGPSSEEAKENAKKKDQKKDQIGPIWK